MSKKRFVNNEVAEVEEVIATPEAEVEETEDVEETSTIELTKEELEERLKEIKAEEKENKKGERKAKLKKAAKIAGGVLAGVGAVAGAYFLGKATNEFDPEEYTEYWGEGDCRGEDGDTFGIDIYTKEGGSSDVKLVRKEYESEENTEEDEE